MVTLAFFNNKGGTAKSTAAINTAYEMSRLGKSVVVADCDGQRNSFNFFFSDKTNGKTRYKNLDVMFSDGVPDIPPRYDYAVLDFPPALNDTTRNILAVCDFVFVPIELGTFSISGIANVTEAVAVMGARFGGCFVSKFDRKNPADRKLDEMLRHTLGQKAMATVIPYSRVIKNSISYRLTAFEYMNTTAAAKAYTALTGEIMNICGEVVDNAKTGI